MSARWSTPSLRWLDFAFPLRSSIFRWPELMSSYFGSSRLGGSVRGALIRLPELEFSFIDDVIWSFVTAFESIALVSMLGFFFLFCGCTI